MSRVASGGAILALAALTGCGYAKRDQVDAQFDQIRAEMETSHQTMDQRTNEVSSQVQQLDTRVNGLEQRTAALERDLQALRTDFNMTVERMEGMLAFSTPVRFDFDEAEIRPGDHALLDRFAAVVKQYYPNAVVTVEGFTDAVGSEAYNQRLGMDRAEAVMQYLVATGGLESTSVRAVSYGESAARRITQESGPGEAGMENRRVSLVIDYTGAMLNRSTTDDSAN